MKKSAIVLLQAITALVLFTLYDACVGAAFAQNAVLMYASTDGGTKGINLPVRVDALGQLIISNPGGGGGGGGTVVIDGGLQTYPVTCAAASPHKYTSVGTASTITPATAAAGRLFTRVCNSLEASGSPLVKCRTDSVAPALGATPGEVLAPGDCVTYTLPAAANILCIASAAATPVSTFECQ